MGWRNVKSAIATTMSRTTGAQRYLTITIQCGWAWTMRFSPGSNSLVIGAYSPATERVIDQLGPLSPHSGQGWIGSEEFDQGAGGQVRPVSDRPFHRAVPHDDANRHQD